MKSGPRDPTDPHKNKRIIIKDISNTNIPPPSKDVIFLNPLFIPFQHWKDKQDPLLLKNHPENPSKTDTNNINRKLDPFTMNLDNVLDKIRKDRVVNSKQLHDRKLHNFAKLRDGLDESSNRKLILMNKLNNSNDSKEDIATLLKNISDKYNLIQSSSLEGKTIIPPLPPPPSFPKRQRRRTSLYIPPDSRIFHPKQPPPPPPLPTTPYRRQPSPPPPPPPRPTRKVDIDVEVESLNDLLRLIEKYPLDADICYNIDMESIHNIGGPITELNQMIGMNKLKNSIVDQVLYFAQDLHISKKAKNQDFMHTVIYGPPGTGKTEVAKIMGKIFSSLGVLKRNTFKKVTRSDLIAGYLGQTAIKTRDVIRECLGGVLFIDEAYSLGNPEKRDSFAKECIDTLCEALSDNKEQLMVIVAGYQEDLKKCFFAYNQGLDSRFPWRFKTDDYNASELNLIFQKKVKDAGWKMGETVPDSWFQDKIRYFKFFGRDMETLLSKTKIAHARRVFCRSKDIKKKITLCDLEKGFAMFLDNDEVQERTGKGLDDIAKLMYL